MLPTVVYETAPALYLALGTTAVAKIATPLAGFSGGLLTVIALYIIARRVYYRYSKHARVLRRLRNL